MKKTLKISTFVLVLAIFASALVGCGSKKMEKSEFESALAITAKNVTVRHEYDWDGNTGHEEIRVVDGFAYSNPNNLNEWFKYNATTYLSIFDEISRCYGDVKVKKRSYIADTLTVVDALGYEMTIQNVSMTFDSNKRLTKLYYEEVRGAGLYKYTYTLGDYDSTVSPI